MDPTPIPYDRGRGGQAIGEGISAFGNALSRLGREQTAEAEAQEQFDVKMKADEYTYQRSLEIDDRIANYNETQHGPPGEFDARYAAEREAKDKEFVAGIKGSPKAQRLAMAMVQNSRQSAIMRAQNARQGFVQQSNIARVMAMVDNAGDAMDGNPETVATAHAKIAQDVAIVPGLTPAQRNRAMDVASKKLWDKWLLKADEAQLERGLADYQKGRAEWSKKFEQEEAERGPSIGPIKPDRSGRIDPAAFQTRMEEKVANSPLNGYVPKDGDKFGIKTGAPREWARLFTMVIQQESGHRVAQRNPDGSLRRFATTIPTEKSFGPGQFNIGEYGLRTWDEVNDPDRVGDALIEVAKQHVVNGSGAVRGPNNTGLAAYFGSIRRPHETLQHSRWWDENVGRKISVATTSEVDGKPVRGGGSSAPLSTSPEAEAPDGTMPAPIKRFALPDRATPYDHMVNNFGDIAPKVQERLEKYREHREKVARFTGIMGGEPWNFNDPKARKEFDEFVPPGVGDAIAMGTPISKDPTKPDPTTRALVIAANIADKANYVPPNIYAGLKTLTDSPDVGKKVRGYTAVLGFYDKNPNIFDQHGDKSMLVEAEKFRRYSRFMDPDKAVAYMIEQNTPGSKLHKAATKDEVEKFLKKYEGENGLGEVAKDMDEGWSKTFGVLGAFSRPTTNADHKVRAAILHDYREALRIGYETQGSETGAKSYASVLMRSRYGVSNLFGREALMDYPPERMFAPDAKGSHAYIEKEARELAGIYNTNADPATVRLRTRPVSEWHEGKPTYSIVINRKDNGLEEVVPQRFQPGNPMADEKAAFDAARAARPPTDPAAPPAKTLPSGSKEDSMAPDAILRRAIKGGEVVNVDGSPIKKEPSVSSDTYGGYLGAGRTARSLSRKNGPSVGGN